VAEGAIVTALDQNPEMLEQARTRLAATASGPQTGQVTWLERTASEIDGLPAASFDAAVASLCLSEMSAVERAFVLRQLKGRLRPGGVLAVADEVRPRKPWQRAIHALLRAPQAVLGWLLAGSTSRPVPDLAGEVRAAGFDVREEERWLLGRLAAVTASTAATASSAVMASSAEVRR
jgi:demethylmenaquinone methyltransferase/2-methoxy-6-polyprenyl-1,4-benzoquinol methylase